MTQNSLNQLKTVKFRHYQFRAVLRALFYFYDNYITRKRVENANDYYKYIITKLK